MSKSRLRNSVIGLTIITAVIHLVVLNIMIYPDKGTIDPLFTLNGLGYFALLAAFMDKIPFLKGKETLVHYGLIGYTIVTIIAYFVLGSAGTLEYFTKADEALLVITAYMHLQKSD